MNICNTKKVVKQACIKKVTPMLWGKSGYAVVTEQGSEQLPGNRTSIDTNSLFIFIFNKFLKAIFK